MYISCFYCCLDWLLIAFVVEIGTLPIIYTCIYIYIYKYIYIQIRQCMWSQLAPRMLRASLAQRCLRVDVSTLKFDDFPKESPGFEGVHFQILCDTTKKTRIYVHYDLWIQWIKTNQRLVTTQSKDGGWCSGKPTCLNYPPENIKVKECNMRKKNAYLQQMEFGWQSWNNIYSLLTFRYGLVGMVKWSFQKLSELQLQ